MCAPRCVSGGAFDRLREYRLPPPDNGCQHHVYYSEANHGAETAIAELCAFVRAHLKPSTRARSSSLDSRRSGSLASIARRLDLFCRRWPPYQVRGGSRYGPRHLSEELGTPRLLGLNEASSNVRVALDSKCTAGSPGENGQVGGARAIGSTPPSRNSSVKVPVAEDSLNYSREAFAGSSAPSESSTERFAESTSVSARSSLELSTGAPSSDATLRRVESNSTACRVESDLNSCFCASGGRADIGNGGSAGGGSGVGGRPDAGRGGDLAGVGGDTVGAGGGAAELLITCDQTKLEEAEVFALYLNSRTWSADSSQAATGRFARTSLHISTTLPLMWIRCR